MKQKVNKSTRVNVFMYYYVFSDHMSDLHIYFTIFVSKLHIKAQTPTIWSNNACSLNGIVPIFQ
jgi:hypothetical protein